MNWIKKNWTYLSYGALIFIAVVLIGLILFNLEATVSHAELSPLYELSNSKPNSYSEIERWAIIGQIGDVLSGHFSALAFIAVAFSVILQVIANKQMRESIDKQEEALVQQGEALKVQSKSLEAQIGELQESRKESSKQTEEFFINNMNVKLDRYYKLLDENMLVINEQYLVEYKHTIDFLNNNPTNKPWRKKKLEQEVKINNVIVLLNFIYDEINELIIKYPSAYEVFNKELSVRLSSNFTYFQIKENYKEHPECRPFNDMDW